MSPSSYAHPNRQYNVDYLQEGDIEWNVPMNDDLASKLYKYRCISIKGARKGRFLSDIRLLSILNIFPYGHLQGYYSICEVVEGIDCQEVCRPTAPAFELTVCIRQLEICMCKTRFMESPIPKDVQPTYVMKVKYESIEISSM